MVELGWIGLAFPESVGGGGGDLLDLAVVYEEAGRVLAPTTLYSTVTAALLLDRAGDEAQHHALLAPVLRGERLMSLALHEATMRWSPDAITTTISVDADGTVTVSGEKLFVPNTQAVDDFIVVGRGDEIAIVVVPSTATGVTIEPHATFSHDAQAAVRFDRVHVTADRVLAAPAGAWPAVTRTIRDSIALQCVEMIGGAAHVLEMTIDYVSQRIQFGRPIGSFQAVQHHVANISTAIDAARLAAWQAVGRCAAGDDAEREVAIAKVAANEAYVEATLIAHELHGGIGFAVDHGLHRWSDRARTTAQTFGTTDDHLRVIGRRLAAR